MANKQDVFSGIRSDVAYAKTGLALLLEDGQKKVKKYKGDISRAEKSKEEMEQRILDLPGLIENKEMEYKCKFAEAKAQENQAQAMDNKKNQHDRNASRWLIASGGTLGLVLLAVPTFGTSIALAAPMAAGISAFAWKEYQNAEDCRKAAKILYQGAFEIQKEGLLLHDEKLLKEAELQRAKDQIKEKQESIKALEKEIVQLRDVSTSIENIYVKVNNADENLKTNM